MNIQLEGRDGPVKYTMEQHVRDVCSGSDYASGSLETLQSTVENTQELVSRLLYVLARKGLLNIPELNDVLSVGWKQKDKVLELEKPTEGM